MNISVSIVEDDAQVRASLAKLIDSSPGFRCVSRHGNAEVALQEIPKVKPDVTLMDINLPGINGVECARRLKPQLPATQIIMLTVYQNTEHIFNALAAGATGYLLKQTPPNELLAAIRDVHAGGSPMSGHIARKIVQSFQQSAASLAEAESLSPREAEVLGFAGEGISLQGNCRHHESDLRHRSHAHPPRLRKTARPFADGSGGQAPGPEPAPARTDRDLLMFQLSPELAMEIIPKNSKLNLSIP